MADPKIKLVSRGMDATLKSRGVAAFLLQKAQRMAASAGPGMVAEGGVGANRARATVRTATNEARRAEATDRKLTRAFDAGR